MSLHLEGQVSSEVAASRLLPCDNPLLSHLCSRPVPPEHYMARSNKEMATVRKNLNGNIEAREGIDLNNVNDVGMGLEEIANWVAY
uniref:Uncharacterized protein n=1 Tax=Oryza barthii TaxID=65489 RepID=A0A0D3GSM6_9ORYZ